MKARELRQGACALVVALALPLAVAQPPKFPAEKSAPLLKGIYASPMPEDRTEAWKVVGILQMTGHSEDAERVRLAHERRVLHKMLGEPPDPPASVEETIARESRHKQGLQALRDKLRARLAVTRDDEAAAGDAPAGWSPGPYQGHGVWIRPTTEPWQKHVVMRVKMAGPLASAPIATLEIELGEGDADAPGRWRMRFTCFPDEKAAADGARRATCNNRFMGVPAEAALEALGKPKFAAFIRVRQVDTPLLRVSDSRTIFDEDSAGRQKAFELLKSASCAELGSCGKVAAADEQPKAQAKPDPKPEPKTPVFEKMKLDLGSAFFRELVARPFPASREEVETLAFVFDHSGNWNPGSRLRDWADRRDLLALLGEPFEPPATVGEAVDRAPPEGAFQLRQRAVRAVLSVDRAPSRGDEVTYSGPIKYLGDSVWRGGHSNLLLWLRVRATNHYREPIEEFHAQFRHSSLVLLSLRCSAEEGGAIPAGKTVVAVCHDNADGSKPAEAVEGLMKASIPTQLQLITIVLPKASFGVQSSFQPKDPQHLRLVQLKAREMIEATSCEALNACAQVTHHRREEAARQVDWRIGQALREAEVAKKRAEGRIAAFSALAVGAALTILLAVVGRRTTAPSGGFVPSLFAAWTVVTGVVVGLAALAALLEGDRLGYGAFLVFGVFYYVGPAFLLGVLCLGVAMIGGGRRTIWRMGSLGIGLSVLFLTLMTYVLVVR